MPNLTREQIVEFLRAGTLDRLVGAIEDDVMDAKGEPYHLGGDRGCRELAKDVSAFANARGGIILIGARTERSPLHQQDEIAAIRPFDQSLVHTKRYHDVIREWVHPAPQGVDIRWYESATEVGRGIVAIIIPDQPPTDRPFLIAHSIDDTGRVIDLLVGYAERRRAGTEPARLRDIHVLLRDGRRFDELHRRLDAMAEQFAQAQTAPGHPAPQAALAPAITETELDTRRGRLSMAAELNGRPLFSLAAIPAPAVDFPGFLRQDSPLVKMLDNPSVLRVGGFDMNLSRPTDLVAGQMRRTVKSANAALELGREGALLFIADGDSYLCWGTSERQGRLRINSLALSESTYSFARLSAAVYMQAATHPVSVRYVISLHNMTVGGKAAQLSPGPIGPFGYKFAINPHDAPDSHLIRTSTWDGPAVHPGKVAFRLAREVYAWFGIGENLVPYVAEVDGEHVIEPELIKQTSK